MLITPKTRGGREIDYKYILYYNKDLDTSIRNIDGQVYRELKAAAALEGTSIGDLFNRAVREYLLRHRARQRQRRLADFPTRSLPDSERNLSERVDEVLYEPAK